MRHLVHTVYFFVREDSLQSPKTIMPERNIIVTCAIGRGAHWAPALMNGFVL